jgi:hypothetical protein
MVARGQHRPRAKACRWLGLTLGLVLAIAFAAPAAAQSRNLTYSEFKFGVLKHDARFLGGVEGGIDLNPEFIFASPVPDLWAASLPWYLSWMVQPRPTVGGLINTSGFTNQAYFGATWTWQLFGNVLMPGDGITFGIFFGPSFNDGETVTTKPNRKSLGSNVLFRESFELGYRITPAVEISAYLDHV